MNREELADSLALPLESLFAAYGKSGRTSPEQFEEYLESLVAWQMQPWEMVKIKSKAKEKYEFLPAIAELRALLDALREQQTTKQLANPTCSFCGGNGFEVTPIDGDGPLKGYPYTQARPCRCISARKVA
jgi:hypothetical protein